MAEQKTALQPKPMAIHTCYVVDIKSQLVTVKGEVTGSHKVDESIMHATRKVCLDALKFCAELFLKEWDSLKGLQFLEMKRRCDVLIHTTKASTSKYAFDGSGTTNRRSVYHYEHGNKKYNYSVCKFQNGKIYNCDLNASYNIGARFFLREYEKLDGCPKLPPVPMRTLDTLLTLLYSSGEKAA